ncbi:hypothetical protein LCGC14_2184090 [marine sediment metagenome]|uniref:DUF7282 domain-containing protein n=1 Tax=marine sediment metagenome TaxID=412755 RepID=A0A0F9E8H5_9ZZZZ
MFNKFMTTGAIAALLAGTGGAAFAQTMINTDGATFSGSEVEFENIEAPNDGWLVIHEVVDGQVVAPASIGHAWLEAGTNDEVEIDIGTGFEEGRTYVAMMHDETNGNESYDFAEGSTDVDTPTMNGDAPVVREFVVQKAMMMDPDDMGSDDMGSDDMDSDDMEETMEKSGMMDMMPMIGNDAIMISGNTATFPMVMAAQDGYLTIHATENGAPVIPGAIGHTMIMAGENSDVAVEIDAPFVAGQSYVAMIHAETNGNESYEFGEGMTDVDVPAVVDGKPVTLSFMGG